MNEYWEVLDPLGKKLANTGSVIDAIRLCEMRGQGYTYRQVKFIMDQVIDITSTTDKQLPTTDIVVNMDGGVGGSWKEIHEQFDEAFGVKKKKQLNQSDVEVFVP